MGKTVGGAQPNQRSKIPVTVAGLIIRISGGFCNH